MPVVYCCTYFSYKSLHSLFHVYCPSDFWLVSSGKSTIVSREICCCVVAHFVRREEVFQQRQNALAIVWWTSGLHYRRDITKKDPPTRRSISMFVPKTLISKIWHECRLTKRYHPFLSPALLQNSSFLMSQIAGCFTISNMKSSVLIWPTAMFLCVITPSSFSLAWPHLFRALHQSS